MQVRAITVAVLGAIFVQPVQTAAVTGGHVMLTVDLTKGVEDPCTVTTKPDPSTDQVDVKAEVVKDTAALAANSPEVKRLSFALKLKGATTPTSLHSGGVQKVLLTGGPPQLADYDGATFVVKRSGKEFCSKTVSSSRAAASGQDCGELLKSATADAIQYIKNGGIGPLVQPDGVVTRTIVVPILPDGTRYGQLPSDITERDKFQLVAVVPSNATVAWEAMDADGKTLHSTTCNAPPLYRNLITGGEEEAGKQKARTEFPLGEIQPRWHAPFGHGCENSLSYVVKITLAGCNDSAVVAKDSITTEKVYDFLLGAGFGYDFGSPVHYSSQSEVEGTTTQKVLVRTRDQTGLKPIVTLSYFPFGANPNNWEYRNWVSPFIGLDPTRFDKGAIAGVNFQPFGIAFSLLAGVSVYQSEKLSAPVGLQPGQVIPTGTDISTRNTFNSDGLGFFLGANFTTESLKLFLTKGAQAFGAASK